MGVVDVDESGEAEESRTGTPGRSQSTPGPQGLLQQQGQILCQGTTTSSTPANTPSTQVVSPNATVTPIAPATPTPTPMAAPTTTSGATLTQASQATGGVGQVPMVKNLSGTLANSILCQEFRDYLILLESKIPIGKRKFQVWLDLVLLCQNIFSLPEADESEKRKLMVQVGKDYLPRLAVSAAVAKKELQQHCKALESDEGSSMPVDLALLRRAVFESIWQQLEAKHDAWRASRAQPTRLQQLCALL